VNLQTPAAQRASSTTEVSMPNLKGMVGENSNANIRVAEGGDSDVRVIGSVKGETKSGQRIELGSSEAVRIDAGGKAGEVHHAGPARAGAPHLAEISYPDPTRATTLLAWKAVSNAASYHVMVDWPYFNRPWWTAGATPIPRWSCGGSTWKYYWRVAAPTRTRTRVSSPTSRASR
jgi:hypothetical protein